MKTTRILTIGQIPFCAGRIMRHSDPEYIAHRKDIAEQRRLFFILLGIFILELLTIYRICRH